LAVFGVVKRRNVGGTCPGPMEFDEYTPYTRQQPASRVSS